MKGNITSIFLLLTLILTVSLTSGYFQFSNKADLTFIESSSGLQTIALDGGRTEIEMTDINKDGNIDFISIGDHGNPNVNTQEHGIMLWYGNGTGSNWSLVQNGAFGYGGIACGDINNDGKMDVSYSMHHNYSGVDFGDQLIEAALGNGTGSNWTPWDDSLATQGETYGMFSNDLGDINNDGLLDIGSVSFGCCAGVHIYKNLGNGIWRQTFGFTGGNCSMDIIFGDMNNDGNLDFAAAHSFGTPYFGDGNGGFVLRQGNLPPPGNSGYRGISLGDVDNDGAKELAYITSAGQVNVWKWNNTTQVWDNLSTGLPSASSYSGTALYDMNKDGFVDLVLFASGGSISVWIGNGGTAWTQNTSITLPSPGGYSDMTIGDADHNGYADIIVESSEQNGFNSYNKIKFFKESTPFSTANLTPQFPKGFERFKNNSVVFIDWISASEISPPAKVRIEFSSTGSSGPWTQIADSLPNNGRYQWTTPASVTSANCFLRYRLFTPGNPNDLIVTTLNPFIIGNITGIVHQGVPAEFSMPVNYPNPFNPFTEIRFNLPQNSFAEISLFNSQGKFIEEIIRGQFNAGEHSLMFDGSDLSSGVYFYQLEVKDYKGNVKFKAANKMILLK